ncbi:MAG TPA: hypothetical protein VFC82_02425 [Actinomycetaceae bacterium]|nr:hypothetical protein [Actinomycetaceae bacterium]
MWYLDIPTQDEMKALAEARANAVVSLYLPTTPVTPQGRGDSLVFRNLADEAVAALTERDDVRRQDREAIAEKLYDLVDDVRFWATQANGLGVIVTPEREWTFRLPHAPAQGAHIGDRAHLIPLFAAAATTHDAHVLCLSEGSVRLVDVSADLSPQEVDVPELAAVADGRLGVGARSYSQRLADSEAKGIMTQQYARAVDDALRPFLRGDERPLILIAPRPINDMFHQVCSYPYLLDEDIQANPDRWSVTEVAEAVQPVLDTYREKLDAGLAELVDQRMGEGRVMWDLANIARAATMGAVDTFVVDRDYDENGYIDDAGAVTFDENGYSLVGEVARRVASMSGTVLPLEERYVHGGTKTTAILRYSL